MRRFIAELRCRKVHRAALLYLVGGYATIEASDLLVPLLDLPSWTVRLILALVIVGFPLAMALAWVFDLTSIGLVRTEEVVGIPVGEPASSVLAPPQDDRTSILVAPFANTSSEPGTEYIADGLTDEIITALSKIRPLRVIARASTMRLKGVGEELSDRARDLGVHYVLDGSVRKSGGDLRITTQLIHLGSEEPRWSERYAGTLEDLFTIQEEVATSVAHALALQLGPGEDRASVSLGIEDPRALDSYLRARFEVWKFSREGILQAERHLNNGLAIVGDNALLYAALGHVYAWYAGLGLDPDGERLERAEECVGKVFALEPNSWRGFWLQGLVRFHRGDLRAARAPLEKAHDARPNNPDTLMLLGYLCALSGQHSRARQLFERALDVDPLTPLNHGVLGFLAVMEGRSEDALEGYRKYRDMDPESPFAVWCWIWALLHAGRVKEAEPEVAKLASKHPESLYSPVAAALLHGVRGEGATATALVSERWRQAAMTNELFSRELTHCYALAGRSEEALEWLENTIKIGNVNYLYWSHHDPWLDHVRGHPRFSQLLSQVQREWSSLNPALAT